MEDNSVARRTGQRRVDDERWRQQQTVLRRAAAGLAQRWAESAPTSAGRKQTCQQGSFDLAQSLEDPSSERRNAAVRAFYDLNPDLAPSFFNKALIQGSADERRKIGAALVGSGLADLAVDTLTGESQERSYTALSLLFLVAKAGQVEPLLRVIKDHPNIQLRLAVIKLLALNGEPNIVTAFFELAQRSSLPREIRSAVREAIFQFDRNPR